MDDGFGELYCELKVLNMKTEDGFVKKKKKKMEAKLWFMAEFNDPRLRNDFESFAILAKFSSDEVL